MAPSKPTASAPNSAPSAQPDKFADGYDFLLINRDIEDPLFAEVLQAVTTNKHHDKLVVVVVTYGGQANVAYRAARIMQDMYSEVVAFLPSVCKSAGTLLVTAAHSVVITPFGELGPLDVQQVRRDELIGRRSGLTTRSALQDLQTHTFNCFDHSMFEIIRKSRGSISFKMAAELSAKMAADVMSGIYAQINPEALGQDFRDLAVAKRYCERLDKRFGNLKPNAVNRLVYDYPSHDFVIDLEEAKEIFVRAELPTPTLVKLAMGNQDRLVTPRTGRQGIVEMLKPPLPTQIKSAPSASDKPRPAQADGASNEPTQTRNEDSPNGTSKGSDAKRNGGGTAAEA